MKRRKKAKPSPQVLKTCPFCGRRPKLTFYPTGIFHSCHSGMRIQAYARRKETLIRVWNKRADSQ